ncbi:O-antigen ligase family protein [Flavobacterium collinsii]|uniref:O-antigen ligase family protein n=1 Tax=Flavobacterium collinsii TaxID=1114861 RepID=UPI002492226D|nr:O-antigen ligase family protein [Flavobacterium collinsii]
MISVKKITSKNFLGTITALMFVLLCFAYPISAITSNVLGLPSTLVNVTYRAFNLLIALYVILVLCLTNFDKITINRFSIPLLCFFGFYFLRIFWDTIIVSVSTEQSLIEIYSFYIGSIIFPVIAILLAFKFADLKKTFMLMFYVLALTNILMMFFYFSQSGWVISPEMLMNRAEIKGENEELLIINPISFGLYGGYLVLLCLSFLMILKDSISKKFVFLICLFLFIGFANLILGTSRGPFLFTFLGIVLISFFHFSYAKFSLKYSLNFLMTSIFITLACILLYIKVSSEGIEIGIIERMINTKENIQSGDKESRNELFMEAISMFEKSPIWGEKIVLDSTSSYPHNAIVEVLMATGLIGFILYLFIIFNLFVKFIIFKRYTKYFVVIFSLFVLSYGISLTTGNLYQSVDNWNLIAVLLCFSNKLTTESFKKM